MVFSNSTTSYSMKTKAFAIIVVIALFIPVAFKIASNSEGSNPQVNGRQHGTVDIPYDINASSDYQHNRNGYFTSMEAEFNWNHFMVPGYDLESVDLNQEIERDRDTGRKLYEDSRDLKYRTLRGLRNGD